MLDSPTRPGTLRDAAGDVPLLLYEAGEALRFDELAIRAGLKGVLRVMRRLGMLPAAKSAEGARRGKIWVANNSVWLRAPQSGILRSRVPLGGVVGEGDVIGYITDPFGESEQSVVSHLSGVLIGITELPLVHEGEALYHVATTASTSFAERAMSAFNEEYEMPLVKRLE